MVGAHETRRVAAAKLRHFDPAMAADIGEGADLAVLAAHDHHRLAGDATGDVVTRIRNLLLPRQEEPLLREDALLLERLDLERGVEAAVEVTRGQ